ncbi:MAG: molybdopterin molybdotransferase MoeA [Gammaproteobacteria bacterium]|nr:molybdopterin molybdotransferase MoeA [Gammaproteobacteria bacterium]
MKDESPLITAQQQFAQKLPFRSQAIESLPLLDAIHRVNAANIEAPLDSPPYARAIVEGFIVNTEETKNASEETPVSFTISGKTEPGDETPLTPAAGEAIEIATGSIIAEGNLTTIRMWEAERDGNTIKVSRPFPPRFFIEEKGCDINKDDLIMEAGKIIDAEHIGIFASMGMTNVDVIRKPKVSIFASGKEVIPHTEKFKPGYIYDCNSPMLAAAVVEAGATPTIAGIQPDDFDSFVANVKTALNDSDMIVISGGTAIGGRDFISDLIKEVGELIIDGVPMRSGRPLIMGISGQKPIVCVAGHPPEALRGFHLFGKLALNYLTGASQELPEDTVTN